MLRIISSLGLVIFLCLLCTAQEAKQTESSDAIKARQVAWLKSNLIKVRSIAPDDNDFSDLQPLKKVIGNSRIVMLGEQSHGDGATFQAKIRLIKFLHQEMGFSVIAFESGMYDCRKAWSFIQSGEDSIKAASRGIFPIWTNSQQVQPLLQYLGQAAKTAKPLELAGFDMQLTGSASRDFMLTDFEKFLAPTGPETPEGKPWLTFKATFEALSSNPQNWQKYPAADQANFFDAMKALQPQVEKRGRDTKLASEAAFWGQMLRSLEAFARFMWTVDFQNLNRNPDSVMNLRDKQMGENLLWLADNYYRGRKIIAWGATSHFVRNRQQVEPVMGMIPMGHLVSEALKDQAYTLGFTAYKGQMGQAFAGDRGKPRDIGEAEAGTLEDLMNAAGYENSILDFRHLPKNADWLRQKLTSRPMGYGPMKADWTQIMDGMMFIREMIPSTKSQ